MKKTNLLLSALISISFYFTIPPYAIAQQQTNTAERERRLEKEKLQELETLLILPKVEKEKKIMFDLSGWFSSTARYYENTDNNKSVSDSTKTSFQQDFRLWGSWIINQKHLAYLRIKDSYIQRGNGDGYTGVGDDRDGPHIDNAYISLALSDSLPTELTLGRQYLYIGRGISYSAIHDGVKLLIMPKDIFIKAFYTQALNHEEDIDASIPDYDKESQRIFAGTEVSWRGFLNNIFYSYFLLQHHLLDETLKDNQRQAYNYDSQYIGLGFEGQKDTMSYWGELIKEYGKSYTDAAVVKLEKKDVDAWAANAGIRKDFNIAFNPGIELEYAYGSGDEDRTYVTDTIGGNLHDNDDNFLYFGDFFSGYALETRLSNIHIIKVEGSIKPFSKVKRFHLNDMDIGLKYFFYRKDQANGGTYDTESVKGNAEIGEEVDAYIYWKPTENFNVILRAGSFFPGEAYPEITHNSTQYFYLRTTIYF